MTTRTVTLGWLLLLGLTLAVAVFNSGCGSAPKPAVAKPKKMTEETPLVCFRIEREGRGEVIFCASEQMCEHAHTRVMHLWEPLVNRYGATGLSECTPVTATFVER